MVSHVMVIRHEVFTLLRGQFANLGPHPAKSLFGFFGLFGQNEATGRKDSS